MQKIDTRPGFYYVSAIDGRHKYLVAGPYNNHFDALADVKHARYIAEWHDARSAFWAFGTCRSDTDLGPGALNKAGLFRPAKG